MTDLALRPITREVVIRATGQVISLDDATNELGHRIDELRQLKDNVNDAVRLLSDELLARGDVEARWTYREGGVEISMDGPGRVTYEAEELFKALGALAADGVISLEAVHNAVEPVTTFKVKKAGINALAKLGPPVSEVLSKSERPSERPRQVRVKVR